MQGEHTGESADVTLTGGAPADRSAHELQPGAVLGRFVLLSRVGVGGMGVVYAAYDPELDRKVAIKVLLGYSDYSDTSASMEREAVALGRLAHPNVVAVHDVGRHGNLTWVAMEFVAGLTLGAWVRARPRSLDEILAVLTAAGRGLAAAHGAGLVHRDFKPDNVMVDADAASDRPGIPARVRVMDFGLAHSTATADEHQKPPNGDAPALGATRPSPFVGTPAYMAPEQHLGLPVDARSDQFSFCVTAWEVLYGERPFAADRIGSLSLAVAEGKLRPPPRGSRVPRWLRRALERGLTPDPARRFPGMDELLDTFAQGRERARLRRVVAVVAVLAVVACTAWIFHRIDRDRDVAACVAEAEGVRAIWPGPDGTARAEVSAALIDDSAP